MRSTFGLFLAAIFAIAGCGHRQGERGGDHEADSGDETGLSEYEEWARRLIEIECLVNTHCSPPSYVCPDPDESQYLNSEVCAGSFYPQNIEFCEAELDAWDKGGRKCGGVEEVTVFSSCGATIQCTN